MRSLSEYSVIGTGLSGLVGTRLRELSETAPARQNGGRLDFTANLDLLPPGHAVDILNYPEVEDAVANADGEVVLHAAAFTDVNRAWQDRGQGQQSLCHRLNVEGARNIARACERTRKHLIHISTDFVFDGKKMDGYREDAPASPIEYYGATKAESEQVVQEILPEESTIVRISLPYSAGTQGTKPDALDKLLRGLQTGTLYPQFTDTLNTPTDIDDLYRALVAIVRDRIGGVVHVIGSEAVSNFDLAEMTAEAFSLYDAQLQPGSLVQYLKTQAEGTRPYGRFMNLANTRLADAGVRFSPVEESIKRVARQGARNKLAHAMQF